jgi:hypothetical protein
MAAHRLLLLILLFLATGARAAPPENADPALSPWFQSLAVPGTGVSCRSEAEWRLWV